MVQAVAGGTGKFPGFAGLQHVGKGVAEVAAVEFAVFGQVAAVQGSATEVEFERPAAGQPEGVFQLPCGGFQQVRQVVLLDQGYRQVNAGVQFHLHPSHSSFPCWVVVEFADRAACGVAFQNTL